MLNKSYFQLHLIDSIAKASIKDHEELIQEHQANYMKLKTLKRELNEIVNSDKDSKNRYDYLKYLSEELHNARLVLGEKEILEQNVKIWNGNGTRKFLDSRGLNHLKENDLGPVYGHQWRFWNAPYSREFGCSEDYKGKGIDQLQNVIDEINKSKETGEASRRIIMSAWNPEQLDEMALPPCHVLSQYHLVNNKLSCTLYQRSGDVGLGVPFNIASYSFLTHLLAKHCGLEAGQFVHFIGNAHIYDDHIEPLKLQLNNEPYDFPNLEIKEKRENIDDYKFEDFEVNNYKFHKVIKMDMRV